MIRKGNRVPNRPEERVWQEQVPVLIMKHEAFPLKPGDRSSRGPTAPLRIEKVPEHSIAALPDLTLPYPSLPQDGYLGFPYTWTSGILRGPYGVTADKSAQTKDELIVTGADSKIPNAPIA